MGMPRSPEEHSRGRGGERRAWGPEEEGNGGEKRSGEYPIRTQCQARSGGSDTGSRDLSDCFAGPQIPPSRCYLLFLTAATAFFMVCALGHEGKRALFRA